jgi:hypothetical protein
LPAGVREWLKLEFNGDMLWMKDAKDSKAKPYKIGGSTKGRDVLHFARLSSCNLCSYAFLHDSTERQRKPRASAPSGRAADHATLLTRSGRG